MSSGPCPEPWLSPGKESRQGILNVPKYKAASDSGQAAHHSGHIQGDSEETPVAWRDGEIPMSWLFMPWYQSPFLCWGNHFHVVGPSPPWSDLLGQSAWNLRWLQFYNNSRRLSEDLEHSMVKAVSQVLPRLYLCAVCCEGRWDKLGLPCTISMPTYRVQQESEPY